ncbi:MAG: MerR family transcriptional regulator [Tabrizicola sp.]|nr:MerR family transcriptional regulator [Tabrizicola sp.]
MFQIGEFAQIAQVSTRQLRFYGELGLFRPDHVDRQTGYRYYAIRQLPRLNAILALKDLGLSLDQIGLLLEEAITPSQLRGMLLLKKAETEQAIRTEKQRLRHIESRIAQIDLKDDIAGYDVVAKSLPPQAIFATHLAVSDIAEAAPLVATAAAVARAALRPVLRGNLIVLARNEPESDQLVLTVGYTVTRPGTRKLVAEGLTFSSEILPAVEIAATVVRQGTNPESHAAFGAIGTWIESHGYAIAGPSREIFLEPVLEPPGFEKALVEIQFPVTTA